MNWVQRKIYLYNVTFGLYMLDWWERYLFKILLAVMIWKSASFLDSFFDHHTLVVVLLWFLCYNGSRYLMEFGKR
ncbi:hypothetical protein D8674_006810 [Pyrus ussuriensis x Pyrus communis]|uniref:Uncharacterized protein n=1 Tax=Pyrus ussuriensis x Pyrus communis TaxID=2448454 RepID=A0A5N5FVJ7_9ROSA|nr:hypothetical protein D8674_006810 [Pyrus ussuriensis x Pyrus communis]